MAEAGSTLWKLKQERFEGLVERCAPGGHRRITELLCSLNLPKDSKILDVAAGNGAFLARLRSLGFQDFSGIELDQANFQLKNVSLKSYDLNLPFAHNYTEKFDLITAVEIIEHLDNPRHLLRELRKLLRPGGLLVVTTPNIEHWIARLKFALKGEIKHFELVDIEKQRHISPILSYQMEYMFREIGFQVEQRCSGGCFWGPLKNLLMAPLGLALKPFFRGIQESGEMLIYVGRANEPEKGLCGASSLYFQDDTYTKDESV